MLESCRLTDMPPHVYSIARSAYESLRKTAQNQAIVLLGYTGSGKTTNVSHILEYFCLTTTMQQCRQKLRKFYEGCLSVIFICHIIIIIIIAYVSAFFAINIICSMCNFSLAIYGCVYCTVQSSMV